jgi:PhzF family phenazine biosynthesis protein
MPTPLTIVDAFTSVPFRGNPAAVCLLDEPADEGWMRDVAREMNLSETAFCHPDGTADEPAPLRLRWLTPTIEIDLCGHATLATAHVLATERDAVGPIRFTTRSGMLTATVTDVGTELDFPADPTTEIAAPDGLLAALGVGGATVHLGSGFHLVEVADADTVRTLDPDIGALSRIESRGMIVTAAGPGDGGPDVVSRVFAPWSGIDEDPVTGSAHCMVAPHWASRLGTTLHCHQASARGGDMTTILAGDRVRLVGHAVTVAHTTLHF